MKFFVPKFFLLATLCQRISAINVEFVGYLKKNTSPESEIIGVIRVQSSPTSDRNFENWFVQDRGCQDESFEFRASTASVEKITPGAEILIFDLDTEMTNEAEILFLCSDNTDEPGVSFETTTDSMVEVNIRQTRALVDEDLKKSLRNLALQKQAEEDHQYSDAHQEARIVAIQLEEVTKTASYSESGIINAQMGSELPLYVYGFGLTNTSELKLSSFPAPAGHVCKSNDLHVQTRSFVITASADGTMGNVTIPEGTLPILDGEEVMYVCLKSENGEYFLHQGTAKSLQVEVYELLLPVWLMIVFLGVLLCMSGLFSGLNLGLMALDQTELKIVQNTGSETEKRYANTISPVRAHGNFLLCTLLLGNVLVNNTLTILLDTLTSGIIAVIGSTFAIVVFGEIVPQAICSRHGLAVGAMTIWLTKFFMILTFPLSFPISKILDFILGQEMGTVYDKKRLIELLNVTREKNDLEKEEVDIVTGALIYKEKTVRDVMTGLSDCYLLSIKAVLNFETMAEIKDKGYSRIPVYEGHRSNIVYLLFVKDLMFIDPDDNMPLSTVCEFYKNDVNFVFHDTTLNVMLNEFKSGDKGHMAFVQDIIQTEDGDPIYETIGLVTLEDIIEEIIQQEIMDESDVITDNKTKRRRKRKNRVPQESQIPLFLTEPNHSSYVSPQALLAVYQYLTTSIEPFKNLYISDLVLKKLLTYDVFVEIKVKKDDDAPKEDLFIIEKGKPIDFFMLIIEGRVEANVGKEELLFESGPFTYFGLQVLTQLLDGGSTSPVLEMKNFVPPVDSQGSDAQAKLPNHLYIPDYSVCAITDVIYLKIDGKTYQRARKTSIMKRPVHGDIDFEHFLNEDADLKNNASVKNESREFSLRNHQNFETKETKINFANLNSDAANNEK